MARATTLDPGSPKSHQKPRLEGPNLETCTFWGVQTWKRQRFGGGSKPGNLQVQTWKPARFGGSKPGNVNVLGVQTWKPARFGTCTFRGSKPGNVNVLGTWKPAAGFLKRAGFQVWTCQNVQVSRFGPPKTCRFPGLDPPSVQVCRFAGLDPPNRAGFQRAGFQIWTPPKRAGFQVWTPKTCQVSRAGFQVWNPLNVQVSRFGPPKTTFRGSKPGNLHVLGGICAFWGGPNLETCTFWEVQAWKPARFPRSRVKGIAERLWSVHDTTKTTYFTGH